MHAGPDPLAKDESIRELYRIAEWWLENSIDTEYGGFAGEIDYYGHPVAEANKGIILNSRILWFFSATALVTQDARYRDAADRAFQYVIEYFDDEDNGGVFWELAWDGSLVNSKKQTYALCFCIYAFVAYYRLTSNSVALAKSLQYFDLIETHAKDRQHGGYTEAFARDWRPLDDVRLSAEDMNAPKTMNTHLHLLEAYTALYIGTASDRTRAALRHAIDIFCENIVNHDNDHLNLFFDHKWNVLSSTISFGHDIEASWLLWKAGEKLGDAKLLAKLKPVVERLADVCHAEGIGDINQVCSNYDPHSGRRCEEGVWWVQAEALVGFLNAYQLTGEQRYRTACDEVWCFICKHHIDTVGGEWHWLSTAHDSGKNRNYKTGFWKGPYHNGRAMIEIGERLALMHNAQGRSMMRPVTGRESSQIDGDLYE